MTPSCSFPASFLSRHSVLSLGCFSALHLLSPPLPFPASVAPPFLSFSCAQPSHSPFLSYSTVSGAPSVVCSLCLHHRFLLRVPPFLPQGPRKAGLMPAKCNNLKACPGSEVGRGVMDPSEGPFAQPQGVVTRSPQPGALPASIFSAHSGPGESHFRHVSRCHGSFLTVGVTQLTFTSLCKLGRPYVPF